MKIQSRFNKETFMEVIGTIGWVIFFLTLLPWQGCRLTPYADFLMSVADTLSSLVYKYFGIQ